LAAGPLLLLLHQDHLRDHQDLQGQIILLPPHGDIFQFETAVVRGRVEARRERQQEAGVSIVHI
jgi:hypothetical protein